MLGLLFDGLGVLLEREFGVADVEEDGLGFLELEESVPCGGVDFTPDVFGSFFYFGDGVAFVVIEHKAGGADEAEWEEGYV